MIGIVCYNKHPLDTQNHELYRNKSYDKSPQTDGAEVL